MKRTLCIIAFLLAVLLGVASSACADEDIYKKVLDAITENADEYNYLEYVSSETGCIIYASYEWLTSNTVHMVEHEMWMDFANTYSEQVEELCDIFKQFGIESPHALFFVLDGINQETELLVVYNDTVIYSYIPLT